MNIVDKILFEATETQHLLDRLYTRFTSTSSLPVGYEYSPMNYKTVGTYDIPDNLKIAMKDNIDLIKNFNFPKNKDFAIKIVEINIDKSKVNYTSGDKSQTQNNPLVFVDINGSNGNAVYGIVRRNDFTTIYFGKSYVPQTKEKLRVDFMISNLRAAIEQKKIR